MATEDTGISPEAGERIRRERDELRQQLGEAKQALSDVSLRDRFYEHFRQDPSLKDPYGLASAAVRDVTLKAVGPEETGQRLTDWLQEQRRLITLPAPSEEPEKAPPKSPFQGPDPGAAGFDQKVEPMVVGTQTWNDWAKGKTADEQIAAMRRGDAVSPEKVRRAQGTLGRGVP